MRIGVFGGSFNPPHIGHQIVAEHARDALELDTVLWVPNRVPPHRAAAGVATEHRVAMVNCAVGGNPDFAVSRLELDREGPSYMVDTLALAAAPDVELFLILGMDSLLSFSTWREPEKICRLAKLAVYPRRRNAAPATDVSHQPEAWPHIVLDAPVIGVSSTAIRDRIRQGRSVRYLVPDAVHEYLVDHDLYRER